MNYLKTAKDLEKCGNPIKIEPHKLKNKKALVIHSGGMDSSICLKLAIETYKKENVLSISFNYEQRHSQELERAKIICKDWDVDHAIIDIACLAQITGSSLTNRHLDILPENESFNSLVVGRNGLFARLGAIHADSLGANIIYMGIIGVEGNFSGYRDCSRSYMDLKQSILRLDLGNPSFEIRTPLVDMTKVETYELATKLGVLDYLLENTISCYNGLRKQGCEKCPACLLKNSSLEEFFKNHR